MCDYGDWQVQNLQNRLCPSSSLKTIKLPQNQEEQMTQFESVTQENFLSLKEGSAFYSIQTFN